MGGLETDIYRDYYKLSFIDYVFIEIIIDLILYNREINSKDS